MDASDGRRSSFWDATPSRSGPGDAGSVRERTRAGPDGALGTVLQLALAAWLLVSPALLEGPSRLVAAKDIVIGMLLLVATVAAVASPAVRRLQGPLCVVLGVVLMVAAVSLEFGPGDAAPARQWSEIVVGVVLVCLGAARAR